MEIYSIGFTRRSAEAFFGALKTAGVQRLLDVRLKNSSQLAGFAKRDDLAYFLRELCGTVYEAELLLAPTEEMLESYRKGRLSWEGYEAAYVGLLRAREVDRRLDRASFHMRTALLCSERWAERCHRRLAMEYLARAWGGVELQHL